MNNYPKFKLENATLMFRNFEGRPEKYTRAGDRHVTLRIDDEDFAQALMNDGWAVKPLKKYNDDDEQRYYLKVGVRFENRPPTVYLITGHKKTRLTEETIGILDTTEIHTADISISGYPWTVNGKSGIKAYLKTLYVVQEEDDFAEKYADPDVPF